MLLLDLCTSCVGSVNPGLQDGMSYALMVSLNFVFSQFH